VCVRARARVCVNAEERQSVLMKALQKTPPKSFMDAFLELTDWLAYREQSLHTLTFVVNDVAVMDRQISQLKAGKLTGRRIRNDF